MNIFGTAKYVKMAAVFVSLALVFSFIGVASSFWYGGHYDYMYMYVQVVGLQPIRHRAHGGLWVNCVESQDARSLLKMGCHDVQSVTDWVTATRVFLILGILSNAVSFIFMMIYIFAARFVEPPGKWCNIVCSATSVAAAVCYILSVIVYGAKFLEPYEGKMFLDVDLTVSWSYIVTVVAGFCCIPASVLSLLDWDAYY